MNKPFSNWAKSSPKVSTRSFYGTLWRVTSCWKNGGGVDGMRWMSDLEWLDAPCHGMWHTSESWSEETGRHIPLRVREWENRVIIEHCPAHKAKGPECPICGMP